MRIKFVDVQNFRKLKTCRIDFGKEQTVFVGANNSGKTSAMDALICFLKKSRSKVLSTSDFTLSNWKEISNLVSDWIKETDTPASNLSIEGWQKLVPALDIWIHVEKNEIHYVGHIIPTLDWNGGLLGIRLSFEPKNLQDLFKAYKQAHETASKIESAKREGSSLKLWPRSIRDFLDREIHNFFKVQAYILDPARVHESVPQILTEESEPLPFDPFAGLFKIDVINAQRGFTDPNTQEGAPNQRKLSVQLKQYFEKHLNPYEVPEISDLDALIAIDSAKTEFDKKLKESFKSSIGELEGLNYPGFSDPKIHISSKINPIDSLNHDASIQFNVLSQTKGADPLSLSLPEHYNGLGYQNLISMIFNLIRYRDEWMQVGKIRKRLEIEENFIEPVHIVLIEEPEAHLHAQVQQVFIKKAYEVLRNHPDLRKSKIYSTQLVVSTHSSHIAHEVDFINLRYFKRSPAPNIELAPSAEVISLSKTFGDELDTTKFAIRYLKTTHCDLFFADAIILVEGPAERMLVPHFIRSKFPGLDKSFLSILEIGGSHAHTLKPLIEQLGVLTLIITDLDSIGKDSNSKAIPEKGKGCRTGNTTIKVWAPKLTTLDDVLNAESCKKICEKHVRIAYQFELEVHFNEKNKKAKAVPYTFEDALVLTNIDFFKKLENAKGLLFKMHQSVNKTSIQECCEAMFTALENGKKAEMALELLLTTEPKDLVPPMYIVEGLTWLQEELKKKGHDSIEATASEVSNE